MSLCDLRALRTFCCDQSRDDPKNRSARICGDGGSSSTLREMSYAKGQTVQGATRSRRAHCPKCGNPLWRPRADVPANARRCPRCLGPMSSEVQQLSRAVRRVRPSQSLKSLASAFAVNISALEYEESTMLSELVGKEVLIVMGISVAQPQRVRQREGKNRPDRRLMAEARAKEGIRLYQHQPYQTDHPSIVAALTPGMIGGPGPRAATKGRRASPRTGSRLCETVFTQPRSEAVTRRTS